MFSLAGKTSGFKRPGSITNPNCGLPATGYPASHPYAVCPYIIPRAICQIPCHTPHVQVPLDYQLPATVYPAAACHGVPCTIHHIPTYPGTDSHGPLAPKEGRGHEVRSCLIGMTGLTNHVCDHTYIYVNLFSADRIGPRPLSPLRVPLPAARCPLPATRRQPTAPPPGSRREGHDGARPPSWRTPTGTTRGAAPVIVRATMLAPACAQPVSRVPAANDCRTTPRI